jgi:hypothetical protein
VGEALVAPSDPDEKAFAIRFQQTTGAVMAKGVEDTALYRYLRLTALKEVGSDPGRWGASPAEVHARNAARLRRFPRGLLATQTHDTKRSGDVRARIGALSWIPGAWRERVLRWRGLNEPLRAGGGPDAGEEYLIYQTLVGAWPLERERLVDYMVKAMREAKLTTDWVEPDEEPRAGGAPVHRRPRPQRGLRRRPRGLRRRGGAARRGRRPGGDAPEAHRARGPRPLPGRRAVAPVAGRPRQPAPVAACWTACSPTIRRAGRPPSSSSSTVPWR